MLFLSNLTCRLTYFLSYCMINLYMMDVCSHNFILLCSYLVNYVLTSQLSTLFCMLWCWCFFLYFTVCRTGQHPGVWPDSAVGRFVGQHAAAGLYDDSAGRRHSYGLGSSSCPRSEDHIPGPSSRSADPRVLQDQQIDNNTRCGQCSEVSYNT